MAHRTPPRVVTRTMATTFGTVVLILNAVLVVVTLIVRNRVRITGVDHQRQLPDTVGRERP